MEGHVREATQSLLGELPSLDAVDVSVVPAASLVFTGDTVADTLLAAAVWARGASSAVVTATTWAQVPGHAEDAPAQYQLTVYVSFPDRRTGELHTVVGSPMYSPVPPAQ